MSDEEMDALLASAGYTYDPNVGTYATAEDPGGDGMDAETVADDLSIPLEELLEWQAHWAPLDEAGASAAVEPDAPLPQ